MKTYIPTPLSPFVFFVLITNLSATAQVKRTREKYFTEGYNIALLGLAASKADNCSGNYFHRTIGFMSSDNGRHSSTIAANTSFGINAGFLWKDKKSKNYTQIHIDFLRNRSTYIFKDPHTWSENDVYFKYGLFLQRLWYINNSSVLGGASYGYCKGSFGQSFLHLNQNNSIRFNMEETVQFDDSTSVIAKTISFNPISYVIGTEFGFRAFSEKKDRAIDIGLVWYLPLSNTYKREYNFYQNKKLIGKSQVSFGGSTILLNLTYTFNTKISDEHIDSIKLNKVKSDMLSKPHTVKGRSFDIQQKITLYSDLVTVKVWDKGTVDGDIITLYLNGEEILDNYSTSKEKKEIILHLREGENFLVMHAVNLGKVPPNTACIEVEDGSKRKTITINSDLKKSGVLEIIYKPVLN